MSSIAGALYSINGSLLNEISNDLPATQVASSSSGGSPAAAAAGAPSSDSVGFSQVARLFQQLQQIQTTDPADFKKVTADAASQLQQAAQQATDPAQSSFLSSLADKFRQASQSGNLSAFEEGASANGASGRHGHHHHHGGSATQDSSSTEDVLAGLLGSTQTPSGSSSS